MKKALIARNRTMTLTPDIAAATQCYLGRGLKGGLLTGLVDRFTSHSVGLNSGSVLPQP